MIKFFRSLQIIHIITSHFVRHCIALIKKYNRQMSIDFTFKSFQRLFQYFLSLKFGSFKIVFCVKRAGYDMTQGPLIDRIPITVFPRYRELQLLSRN